MWELTCVCGELCYFYTIEPVVDETVYSEHCINADGTPCADGDPVTCPKCGPVNIKSLRWKKMAEAG